MTHAQLVMLGLGLLFLVAGLVVLFASRKGTEAQQYGRRLIGTMGAALGASLVVFALGLAGKLGGAS